MNFKTYYQQFLERAYHGSPHKIEAYFDSSKIGTGHGAQSFGWGFYFSESSSVAKDYIPSSFKEKYIYKGKSGLDWMNYFSNIGDYIKAGIWESILLHKSKHQVLRYLDPSEIGAMEYVNSLPDKLFAQSAGFLYTVELDVKREELLDWHLMVKDQTTFVSNKIKQLEPFVINGLNYTSYDKRDWDTLKGFDVYRGLTESFSIPQENGGLERTKYDLSHKPKSASMMLHSLGIKGIMYNISLSQSSPTDKQKKNFVIFSSSDIEIKNDSE